MVEDSTPDMPLGESEKMHRPNTHDRVLGRYVIVLSSFTGIRSHKCKQACSQVYEETVTEVKHRKKEYVHLSRAHTDSWCGHRCTNNPYKKARKQGHDRLAVLFFLSKTSAR